jgi:hypothetical protein
MIVHAKSSSTVIIIFIAIAFVSSLAWHLLPSRFIWISHIGSVLTATGISFFLASSHMTNSDLMWIAAASFCVSLSVGYVYRKIKK